jgi:hypothetical protein
MNRSTFGKTTLSCVACALTIGLLAACGGGGGGSGGGVSSGSSSSGGGSSGGGSSGGGSSGGGSVGTTGLCQGMVTDKLAHPMTNVAKPALLGSYVDPNFGTTIRRITDVAAQFGGTYAKPVYSTMPAWNADETYLLLYVVGRGHVLLNGKTYAYIRNVNINSADIEHVYWSATDPDALYYPDGSSLKVYHPSSDSSTTVHTFATTVSFGGDPIYGDWASNLFGFDTSSGNSILYDRGANTARNAATTATPIISSSGTYYVQGQTVYMSSNNASVRTMTVDATEHGATGKMSNGQDFWASVQFDLSGNRNGNLIVENLNTGAVTTLIGESNGWEYPRVGTHISAHSTKNPGWVAVSMTGTTAGTRFLDREIALANVNDGTVCRVGHHRSAGQEGNVGYWAEPHVNISPRGTRMIFGSDWNNGNTVDTYVIELPGYTP